MEFFLQPSIIVSFLSLSILEIVLGIDNIIFIAILVQNLPDEKQQNARNIGILLAFLLRIAMLLGVVWIIGLKEPFLTVMEHTFSGKDLMMLSGGLFLIYKSTSGIHEEVSCDLKKEYISYSSNRFFSAILQIILIDLVFSFDSIMTAVGITEYTSIIIAAMSVAMAFMFFSANAIANFIKEYPSLKMLALSFVMMIGLMLTVDAFGILVPKGYIYTAMLFSLGVEFLNIRRGRRNRALAQRKK